MLLRDVVICKIDDILDYATSIGKEWNACIDKMNKSDHFLTHGFTVCDWAFDPEYQDDAFALEWDTDIQEAVKGFMEKNQIKKLFIVISHNVTMTI
jgi:hypothetical protein